MLKIKNKKFFAKGHRAIVYTGFWKNKKVAVKVERKDTKAKDRTKNEVKWLKILNKKKIGPKLISHNKNYLIYNFVEGQRIIDFLKESKKSEIKKVVKKVLMQCRVLDKLKMNKEEMHNPYKHIIIGKNLSVKMIDFERCHETERPKNVTQFCQFLSRFGFKINKKDLKNYKNKQTEKNFRKILDNLI